MACLRAAVPISRLPRRRLSSIREKQREDARPTSGDGCSKRWLPAVGARRHVGYRRARRLASKLLDSTISVELNRYVTQHASLPVLSRTGIFFQSGDSFRGRCWSDA